MYRLQLEPVLKRTSVHSGDQMEMRETTTSQNQDQSLIRNQILGQNLSQIRSQDLTLPVKKAVQVMMKDPFQTEMKMEETLNKSIIVSSRKTESRMDLTTSSKTKKETSYTKIRTSRFKMRLDGMIIHTPVAPDFLSTREVLTGRECEMSTLQTKVTRFGVNLVLTSVTFDRVRLETVGS